MSNLLIHEHPLQVLPELAKDIGLNEAIILQQIHYWLRRSTNSREGYVWVYNSYPQWQEQFPFWGLNTIKRAIYRLEEMGLLVSGSYNKSKIDKTKWYRIDYAKLEELELSTTDGTTIDPKWADERPNLHRPIPETTTETNSNEVNQLGSYRKRLGSKDDEIVVMSEFQAKAAYICRKLGTPPGMQSSVLKACREHPEVVDRALTEALEARVANKTLMFFEVVHGLKVAA